MATERCSSSKTDRDGARCNSRPKKVFSSFFSCRHLGANCIKTKSSALLWHRWRYGSVLKSTKPHLIDVLFVFFRSFFIFFYCFSKLTRVESRTLPSRGNRGTTIVGSSQNDLPYPPTYRTTKPFENVVEC